VTLDDQIRLDPSKKYLKADAILQACRKGVYEGKGIKIEIISLQKMDGGVEVLARAWKEGQQLGFGDGTVEIERFRFFNPACLVDAPDGDIVREWADERGRTKQRKLREDPEAALKTVLLNSISITGKDGTNIIKGKIGHTVSTFAASADGYAARGTTSGWADLRGGAGTFGSNTASEIQFAYVRDNSDNTLGEMFRSIFVFNTADIPDTDTISSAVLSLFPTAKGDNLSLTPDLDIVDASPASNTTIATADYNTLGTTVYGSKAYGDYVTGGEYNNISLDVSAISIDGYTKLGARLSNDTDNSAPSVVSDSAETASYFTGYSTDRTGTAADPVLTVTHAADAPAFIPRIFFF
jgi:hypothetical protein